jgi:polyisoprenoid-binding protein YceI
LYRSRFLIGLVSALLLGLLAACGGSTSQSSTPTQPAILATAAPVAEITAAPAAEATAAPEQTAQPAPDATAAPAAGATAAPAAASSGDVRTFTIVSEQSEASYEVQEKFLNRELPNKAIGKTNAVTGEFQFTTDGKPTGQVTNITVDLSTLTSDSGMRDRRIRSQWLESNTYPNATFLSTGVDGVPESYSEGQEVTFKLNGNMTIRDVTKPVTFDVTGKLEGDTVTGTATTFVLMKDFGFDPPSVAGVLTVQDGVTITVNFTAKENA